MPMLETECVGVSVCKQSLIAALFVCFLATLAQAQSVRISDADVVLIGPDAVSHVASGSERLEESGRSRSRRKRAGNEATATDKVNSGEVQLREAIYIEAARYRIDPDLVFALVWQESRWNLKAVSPKNARGPFQLMPGTAARYAVNNPHDPKQAARAGVAYFVWLLDRFGGNVTLALSAYNSGEFVVDAYLSGKPIMLPGGKVINPRGIRTNGIPPYRETESYVRGIAERYRLIRAERQAASTIVR